MVVGAKASNNRHINNPFDQLIPTLVGIMFFQVVRVQDLHGFVQELMPNAKTLEGNQNSPSVRN